MHCSPKFIINLPVVHSQCESRYVRTGAVACLAPNKRALISPSRFSALTILTFGYDAK